MFKDRYDAGVKLAEQLERYKDENPFILAVPRGGVVTAYETVKRFDFDWDLIIPRKIGAPHNEEYAIGAVTSDGTYFLYEDYIEYLKVSEDYIEQKGNEAIQEIHRRMLKYKGSKNLPQVKDRTVILIDDGIATGFTLLAAIESIKKQDVKKIIIAVPVAARDTVLILNQLVEEVICLIMPNDFSGVGEFYDSFDDISDDEVMSLLNDLEQ